MADCFYTSVDYLIGHTTVRRKIEYTKVFHLNQFETEMMP